MDRSRRSPGAPLWGPLLVMLGLTLVLGAFAGPRATADECPPLLRHGFNSLQTGERQDLCQYRGKVLLVVNTASYCAYTDQHGGLEALYRQYRDRGLVGPQRNALFAELHRRTGEQPRWNFHKYLIDSSGERVLSFGSGVQPDDRRLAQELRKMLDARPVPGHAP